MGRSFHCLSFRDENCDLIKTLAPPAFCRINFDLTAADFFLPV